MNFRAVLYILGWILNIEGAFMLLPFIVALIYGESSGFSFLIVGIISMIIGLIIVLRKPKNMTFFAREGFAVTALSWIVLSIFGCIPFIINGDIPVFTDALFETASGFTTTGASILNNVEALSHASLFWRSFTHWLGGMGVLVFLLALVPMTGGSHMNIMKAESPGPSVDKLLPKVRQTAFVLYAIYFGLTALELIFLIAGKMPVFDAITTAVGTAGTGGFGIKSDSMASYSPYIQWVVGVFMMLFGINFTFYFLLIIKKFRQAFALEEVRKYILLIIAATAIIIISIMRSGAFIEMPFTDKLRHAFFQVSSIITTTGFSTVDYDYPNWPLIANIVIVALMFIGACAGSTGGGIKVSRVSILFKTVKKELTLFFHPKRVVLIKFDRKPVAHETIRTTNVFIMAYIFVFVASVFLVSIDNFDFTTSFTSVAATLNNIGPGLSNAGPTESFAAFSHFSKYVMIFDMIAGRLELYPMLILLTPEFWKSVFSPNRGIRVYK
ncbi:MAG: TrkH family potassium uptake protein [Oscillospiraceae bacterium]|nr:TrkH family potassium uptake protein [Oscillospiraceae bacterium]